MKYMLLVLSISLSLQPATNAQAFRLFHIERNKNSSIVCYDLEVNSNKEIDKTNPIYAYWEMPDANNTRNSLSLIQSKLAYGFTVEKEDEKTIQFKLVAYPERTIKAVYDSEKQHATAFTYINGSYAVLKKLYIYATAPLFTSVEYVVLFGIDPKTGNEITEKIINK